jgi:CRISPR-associated exonuclease Cas4
MLDYKPLDRVNPTLVKQYVYCPVIPWIVAKLGVVEPPTDSMLLGREAARPPEGRGQVYVKTRRGAVVIDEVVEERGSKVIVEKKAYRSHNASRYTAQVVASYLLAREALQGVRRARLVVGDEVKELELSDDLVKDVERVVESLRRVVESDKPPQTRPEPARCSSCWYRRFCPHH